MYITVNNNLINKKDITFHDEEKDYTIKYNITSNMWECSTWTGHVFGESKQLNEILKHMKEDQY